MIHLVISFPRGITESLSRPQAIIYFSAAFLRRYPPFFLFFLSSSPSAWPCSFLNFFLAASLSSRGRFILVRVTGKTGKVVASKTVVAFLKSSWLFGSFRNIPIVCSAVYFVNFDRFNRCTSTRTTKV